MNDNDVFNKILEIINCTFQVIDSCYTVNDESTHRTNYSEESEEGAKSRIIFPCYSDKSLRFSEQELRFIFIEQFTKYCKEHEWNAYYSVETPTTGKYIFSKGDRPKLDEENGRSARIDTCIHGDDGTRICLIEFKAGTPDAIDYVKDFVKLSEEGNTPQKRIPCFFIHLLQSQDSGTERKINDKISKYIKEKYKNDEKDKMKNIIFVRHTIKKDDDKKTICSENVAHLNWRAVDFWKVIIK